MLYLKVKSWRLLFQSLVRAFGMMRLRWHQYRRKHKEDHSPSFMTISGATLHESNSTKPPMQKLWPCIAVRLADLKELVQVCRKSFLTRKIFELWGPRKAKRGVLLSLLEKQLIDRRWRRAATGQKKSFVAVRIQLAPFERVVLDQGMWKEITPRLLTIENDMEQLWLTFIVVKNFEWLVTRISPRRRQS